MLSADVRRQPPPPALPATIAYAAFISLPLPFRLIRYFHAAITLCAMMLCRHAMRC